MFQVVGYIYIYIYLVTSQIDQFILSQPLYFKTYLYLYKGYSINVQNVLNIWEHVGETKGGIGVGGVNFALVWNLKRFIHDHKNRVFFIPLNSYNV